MEELIAQIKEMDRLIDEVVPLLVADDVDNVSEGLQQIFQKLTGVFQELIGHQKLVEQLEIQSYMKSLECFVYAMQVGDTIQLADILLYELRGMFHNIYEFYERRTSDEAGTDL